MRAWAVCAVVGLAFFSAYVTLGVGGGDALDDFVNRWLYTALVLLAVIACATRVWLFDEERAAWAPLAAGLGAWAAGEIAFDFAYDGSPPSPSIADVFYLAFYPAAYVALVLLVRARVAAFNRSLWLDGVMAGLACAAVGAAVLVEVVLGSTGGNLAEVGTNLAYPLGDVLLLALVVAVFVVTSWRPGRAWAVIALGLVASVIADGTYLYQDATNSYREGTILDALWPASMLLLAVAAWQAPGRRAKVELEGRPLLATPAACGLIALAILTYDHFHPLNALAVGLAAATILAVIVRMAMTFGENSRLLAQSRMQAVTDALTGLGNRRRLVADLDRALAAGPESEPRMLIIFDLNGFKQYNDTFGHPAGDALLALLGAKLAEVVEPFGSSYRLGGDEFCVLSVVPTLGAGPLLEATAAALSEEGDGFIVSSAFGAVFLPEEADEPSNALRIADQRLYAQKHSARAGRGQPHEILLNALFEREPGLREHAHGVAELSVSVGRRLGLAPEELEELTLAAQLHDVGKLAIPDAVLHKPGPLTEEEWVFVRQHTLVGQRILSAAPALHGVGKIVRHSHEHWDGTGYVDGLSGTDIPLPARIIAVCDAFAAMTSKRPYRPAMTREQAAAELRLCAGTQFDPEIVRVLCEVVTESPDELLLEGIIAEDGSRLDSDADGGSSPGRATPTRFLRRSL